jgi:hypothetical protein
MKCLLRNLGFLFGRQMSLAQLTPEELVVSYRVPTGTNGSRGPKSLGWELRKNTQEQFLRDGIEITQRRGSWNQFCAAHRGQTGEDKTKQTRHRNNS